MLGLQAFATNTGLYSAGVELRASCMLGNRSKAEPHPQPQHWVFPEREGRHREGNVYGIGVGGLWRCGRGQAGEAPGGATYTGH